MNKLKTRHIIILVFILLIGIGVYKCVTELVVAKRLHRAIIRKDNIELDWFFYSSISNSTPDYITVTKDGQIDTILISNYLKDVNLKKDTIFIEIYRTISYKNKEYDIPNHVFDFYIKVDSIEMPSQMRTKSAFILD